MMLIFIMIIHVNAPRDPAELSDINQEETES